MDQKISSLLSWASKPSHFEIGAAVVQTILTPTISTSCDGFQNGKACCFDAKEATASRMNYCAASLGGNSFGGFGGFVGSNNSFNPNDTNTNISSFGVFGGVGNGYTFTPGSKPAGWEPAQRQKDIMAMPTPKASQVPDIQFNNQPTTFWRSMTCTELIGGGFRVNGSNTAMPNISSPKNGMIFQDRVKDVGNALTGSLLIQDNPHFLTSLIRKP